MVFHWDRNGRRGVIRSEEKARNLILMILSIQKGFMDLQSDALLIVFLVFPKVPLESVAKIRFVSSKNNKIRAVKEH